MKFGVVRFPGSCDDIDALDACGRFGDAEELWHADATVRGVDVIVIPGGFSYGDHLRAGAIARFAPVMTAVSDFAAHGGPVLGICNGFQVLCEAGLLPGALLPNAGLRFVCRQVSLVVEVGRPPFTAGCTPGDRLSVPVKHFSGRYYAPQDELRSLLEQGQVRLRYAAGENPNGSLEDIAAVTNERGNVMGLMPHPEHAVDPLGGSSDGATLFSSLAQSAPAGIGAGA